jgi:hypothetical protein
VHSNHLLCTAGRRTSSRAPPESCTNIHRPSPLEMSEEPVYRQGIRKPRLTLKNSSSAGHSPRSTRFSFLLAIASFAEPIEIPRDREIFFSRGTASKNELNCCTKNKRIHTFGDLRSLSDLALCFFVNGAVGCLGCRSSHFSKLLMKALFELIDKIQKLSVIPFTTIYSRNLMQIFIFLQFARR